MCIIKFHFHSSSSIPSRVVRWYTRGDYSHVSIQLDDIYYHAICGKGFFTKDTIDDDVVETLDLAITKEDYDIVKRTLDTAIGERYDIKALFGFAVGIKYQGKQRWFCSELARYILEFRIRYPIKNSSLVTPHEIYLVLRSFKRGMALRF